MDFTELTIDEMINIDGGRDINRCIQSGGEILVGGFYIISGSIECATVAASPVGIVSIIGGSGVALHGAINLTDELTKG